MRLTDDDLATIIADNQDRKDDPYLTAQEATAMATEIRTRRAADLSAADVEDIKHLAWEAKTYLLGGDRYDQSEYERRCKVVRALSVLSRLTGSK